LKRNAGDANSLTESRVNAKKKKVQSNPQRVMDR